MLKCRERTNREENPGETANRPTTTSRWFVYRGESIFIVPGIHCFTGVCVVPVHFQGYFYSRFTALWPLWAVFVSLVG